MRDLVFVICWLAVIPVCLTRPFLAAMLSTWITLLSPSAYLYGFANSVPIYIATLAVGGLAITMNKYPIRFAPTSTFILFVIFLLNGAIVTIFQIGNPEKGWEIYTNLLKMSLTCFFISCVLTSRLRVHAMIVAIALGFGFHGIVEGLKYIVSGGSHKVVGIISFGDNNQFGVGVLMALPLIFYVSQYSRVRWVRYGFLAMCILCFFTIIGTGSRGSFAGMALLAILAIVRSPHPVRAGVAVAAATALVLTFTPASWFERMDTLNNVQADGSFMSRITLWKLSTLIALDRPFTGGGFRAIQTESVFQTYAQYYDRLSWIPAPEPSEIEARAAHSIYFEVLGDTGFIGLGLFVTMLIVAYRNASAIQKKLKGNGAYSWLYDLARALQMSIIAYAFSALDLSMAYFEFYWILINITAVLRRMSDEVGSTETPGIPAEPAQASRPVGRPMRRYGPRQPEPQT